MRDSAPEKSVFAPHLGAFVAALSLAGLAGCQTFEPPGGPLEAQVDADTALVALQRINERALECWVRSGDRRFAPYALVPELDTAAGAPRILVVARGEPQALPELVITATGDPVRLTTFGPLAGRGLSGRINRDILAWSAGRQGCG
ncbi:MULTISPECIES: hypothetical protein [unclassified Roseitalea]|uniref:hypothetical protein n=1 Tax=unclassified Roseitalea TaxID=2639107 RepID=UPI00273EC22A|nr:MULTISPECIES: hypothetical protein [unclassified Roseitalea]